MLLVSVFKAFFVNFSAYLLISSMCIGLKYVKNVLELLGVALEEAENLRRNSEFTGFCDCLQYIFVFLCIKI